MSDSGGFPCSNCGAQLVVDGSTPAPTCQFCHSQTELPRRIWEQYHPPPAPLPQLVISQADPIPRKTPISSKTMLWIGLSVALPIIGVAVAVPLVVGNAIHSIALPGAAVSSGPDRGWGKVGEACNGRTTTCSKDKKTELVCNTSEEWAVGSSCKGLNGCQISARGSDLTCDSTLGDVGDACEGDARGCSSDHKAALQCVKSHYAIESPCKGPDGCTVTGTTMSCDDHVADVGEPCFSPDRTACSQDHKSLLACVGKRFALDHTCRGAGGCSVKKLAGTKNVSLDCDESIADVGEGCEAGSGACSADGKSFLVCQNEKLALEQKCSRGCVVTSNRPSCR